MAVEKHVVEGRRLGRRPTDPERLARTVKLKLTRTVPAVPVSADHLSKVLAWMMGANNKFGTCGPTSVANYLVMLYQYLAGETITVTDDQVFDLYRRSGNPTFDPTAEPDENGDVPGDGGVDMTVMLSALVSGGISITHADGRVENVKPYCFAALDTDIDTVRAVTDIFGMAHLAVDLQTAQQDQSDANPPLWDYSRSGEWGGHAIPGGSYTSQAGKGQRDESVVSWQMPVGTTDAFISKQLTEAYVVVWPLLWGTAGFQQGVDQAALVADYEGATGKQWTGPTPGTNPTPAPTPTPAPGGGTADALDTTLWDGVAHWAQHPNPAHVHMVAMALRTWGTGKGLGAA